MKPLIRMIGAVGAVLTVVACQTIPYNESVHKTVEEYAVEADRHIVAMGTAWNECYDAYDATARNADRRFVVAKIAGQALVYATDVDDTGITPKDALRNALAEVIDQGQIDALSRIDELFRTYLTEIVADSKLDPLIKGIASRLRAPAQAGQSEQDRRDAVIEDVLAFMFDAGAAARSNCSEAAFAKMEAGFYDDWSSKLFAVQQMAKADDALGLCSKVAGMVKEHADKINEKLMQDEFKKLSFANGTNCSLATIDGVLIQHEGLRKAHKDRVILNRDVGKLWRKTIAQSVRIALTVEKFKKSASEDSDDLI